MKVVFVLFALISVASCLTQLQLQSEFVGFMQRYNKTYDTDMFQARFQIFKKNAEFIAAHNADESKTYKVALNKFADLTGEEYASIYLGFRGEYEPKLSLKPVVVHPEIPTSVDWRKEGAVTHIKNQGQCGSCWSFSATGSTEGSHKIAGNTLVSLSEQQLVDCSGSYGNMGCNGGLMDDAFKYIMAAPGLESESEYPYTASDGTCHFASSEVKAKIIGYHDITSGSEVDLYTHIANVSPISVAIDASHSSFQFYSSGVYYEPACSATQLDHGVLAVGYGVDGSKDYYIVKNSWGTDWGMNGYIWMSRNRNNNCGIATSASYPCTAGQSNCPAT
eukprot:TRINITY_DN18_c0_g1_i3.p1 TRINITY_DN18_c0_g1~~TRINITY_DN18_c0_g1_i3.p1  ORF type:complete len:352 (+),score=66.50 TRINITY_DN18_c0_g1_i3:56-1057(+)